MGASSTLQNFLEWGISTYPADRIGLILWNHGGALKGVCYDENNDYDSLTSSEVKNAVSNAFNTLNRTEKLEWIGYDACLMQLQDIAEFNSAYFNYMVASEETEAGYGWDYDMWIDDLYSKSSTETILSTIADEFIEDNNYSHNSDGSRKTKNQTSYNDQTLSVLDLSAMSNYKTKWNTFSSNLASKLSNFTYNSNSKGAASFQAFMKTVKTYGTSEYNSATELSNYGGMSTSSSASNYYGNYGVVYSGGVYYDYGYNSYGLFDVKDFINKVKANSTLSSTSGISDVEAAFSQVVIHNAKGSAAGNSYGLCLFFPMHAYCDAKTYYTSSTTNFTTWLNSIVKTYAVYKEW